MAFEGVVAYQGKEHITAPQIGRLIAGVCGSVRGILQTQNRIKASMQTANKVRIDTGDVIMDGRLVTNEEPMELNVANGRAGYKRNDLVVLKFTRAVSGIEKFEVEVLSGDAVNTGTPKDPVYTAGDILSGSTSACMPLWRLPIDGITVGEPVCMLPQISSLGSEDSLDLFSCYKPSYSGGSKIFWRAFGNKQTVTIQAQVFLSDTSAWASIKCPFTIPEGYRFKGCGERIKSIGEGADGLTGDELRVPFALRDGDLSTEHLVVYSDGSIMAQNMGGGGHTNGWRWGTLSYAVGD